MRLLAILLATLFLGLLPAGAQAPPALLEDGPHVLWDGRQARVLRVRQGKAEEAALGADHKLQVDGLPALTLDSLPPEPPPCVLPQPARIAAVSDSHGNFPGLVTLLEKHGIMDASRRWTFGQGHLVVVGDTFDRGAGVTECLWLLRSLQAQALKAKGRVHVLLGNHEAMVLTGDLRYLNPKYKAVPGLFSLDPAALYGAASEQGRWLRSLNVALRLGEFLFMHAGPSPELAAQPTDLPTLNAQFRAALAQGGRPPLLGRTGPVWYRGLIPGASDQGDATDAQVTTILQAYQAKRLVVGHSTQTRITAFHQGRIIGIDADLQTAKGELWLWDQGTSSRGLLDGTRVPF